MIKTWFLRSKKLQRHIDIKIADARDDQRIICGKEKHKELTDQALRYEKLLTRKDEKIKILKQKLKNSQKAYDIYKEELQDLKEFFDKLEPGFKILERKFAEGISVFNKHKNEVDRIARITSRKETKIERLHDKLS